MAPYAWSEWDEFVSMWRQLLDELVEREDTCFLEAVEAATNFKIDVAAVGDVDVVVWIVPDFLGNAPGWDVHVLLVGHRGTKIIVLDIDAHVAGAMFGIGNGTVDVYLGCEHGDCWQAGVPWVVKLVASRCHADSVGLFFLGTDVADKVGVGDDARLGYENGAGAD